MMGIKGHIEKIMIFIREKTFYSGFFKMVFSSSFFGVLFFRLGVFLKRVFLLCGIYGQRAIEYTWILEQLKNIKSRFLVLDVGCAESLLCHELVIKGLHTVGIDIRKHSYKNKLMFFFQRNILNTKFKNDVFDLIIMVSTIEHVALKAYKQ